MKSAWTTRTVTPASMVGGIPVSEWFLSRTITTPDGHVLWTGAIDTHGYGVFGVSGKQYKAHRVAYLLFHGEIPKDKQINHTPGHGGVLRHCVNPDHIYAGTRHENCADMEVDGTRMRGMRVPWSKLTDEDVRDIRRRIERGEHTLEIAAKFSVSRGTVQFIKNGRTWCHVS